MSQQVLNQINFIDITKYKRQKKTWRVEMGRKDTQNKNIVTRSAYTRRRTISADQSVQVQVSH